VNQSAQLSARLGVQLDGFALDVELGAAPGEVVAVVGANGAGKTTLLRAVAGLLPLRAPAWVALDGEVLDDPASGRHVPTHRRHTGFVFQDLLLFEHLDARDNVAFGLRRHGVGRREARARALEWLERLGIAERAAARPRQLSRGQAQRVALARALVTEPRLLLLDEPLAAVDVAARIQVRDELRRHLDTVDGVRLLVTHDPADAEALAHRMLRLDRGRIVDEQVLSPHSA
jgi:molybdate transport system ATP-binding protein